MRVWRDWSVKTIIWVEDEHVRSEDIEYKITLDNYPAHPEAVSAPVGYWLEEDSKHGQEEDLYSCIIL
jgi:hypothetical protein